MNRPEGKNKEKLNAIVLGSIPQVRSITHTMLKRVLPDANIVMAENAMEGVATARDHVRGRISVVVMEIDGIEPDKHPEVRFPLIGKEIEKIRTLEGAGEGKEVPVILTSYTVGSAEYFEQEVQKLGMDNVSTLVRPFQSILINEKLSEALEDNKLLSLRVNLERGLKAFSVFRSNTNAFLDFINGNKTEDFIEIWDVIKVASKRCTDAINIFQKEIEEKGEAAMEGQEFRDFMHDFANGFQLISINMKFLGDYKEVTGNPSTVKNLINFMREAKYVLRSFNAVAQYLTENDAADEAPAEEGGCDDLPKCVKCVFMIDDEEYFIHAVTTHMKTKGVDVVGAHDGNSLIAAVRATRNKKPDVILLDDNLGGRFGLNTEKESACGADMVVHLKLMFPEALIIVHTSNSDRLEKVPEDECPYKSQGVSDFAGKMKFRDIAKAAREHFKVV